MLPLNLKGKQKMEQLKVHQRLTNKLVFLLVLIIFSSCKNKSGDALYGEIKSDGKYNAEGLEIGQWKYSDINGKIVEEGFFDNGIRLGMWRYYLPFSDSILWTRYANGNNLIRTNIPNFLKVVETDSNIVVFKNKDSLALFNLVIGDGYTDNFDNYRSTIFEDLKKHHVIIKDSLSQSIETEERKKYLYNFFFGSDSIGKDFYVFNIAGKGNKDKLIEVSLRCEPGYSDIGRKVFFSVIPNLFIDSFRFMCEKENIILFENLTKR